MKVRHVEHQGTYGLDGALPASGVPEFVFIGRSNVGKSSLINTLVARRNLARTSNTPGKTRAAHFYPVNGEFCFVDVPGYGYAAVSRSERAKWEKFLTSYLETRDGLCGVIHLLDIRHRPSEADRHVAALLRESGRPVCVVFNKMDKVKAREVEKLVTSHLQVLAPAGETAVVPFSTQTGAGKRAVWGWIEDRLSA